ncbi:type IV pilin protein [Sulfurovum sp. CS9]|uniref:type IV pilin protein n=1 Tax=Sulfurovum sp. CS9 TaxID=3391146 RepID=UPI0039E7CEF0
MRKAFTMIELIFVIVIIGILSAVAIPKLAATRDDAKATTAINNLSICIMDISTKYTASGNDDASTAACKNVFQSTGVSYDCWTLTNTDITDGNVTVNNGGASTEVWCTEARKTANNLDLNGTHQFGSSKITR